MSDIAILIADMVRAGVDPELIGRTAAALAGREAVLLPDESAQRRRASDRERKRLRNSAEIGGFRGTVAVSDKENPQTPKETKKDPLSPPKGGSPPPEFDRWYFFYPNKVGRGQAEKAFVAARKLASLEELIAGVQRYAAKTDDRPWQNPATWLRGKGWLDEPVAVVATARGSPRSNPLSDAFGIFDQGHQNEPIDITPTESVVRYLPSATR